MHKHTYQWIYFSSEWHKHHNISNFLQYIFLKLYCTVQILLTDSAGNLFLSIVHWLRMREKILSTFPLCAGTAKQNCTNFNKSGWVVALLPLPKYSVHFYG
jgi:hypothetical protein